MKPFLTEFQNRFDKFYSDNDVNIHIEYKLSLKGSNSSLESVINDCINTHVDKLLKIKSNTPLELKHCLETYKLSKINESKRNKIKYVVTKRIGNTIYELNTKQFQSFFDRLRDQENAKELRRYTDEEVLPILFKHLNDIEFELDKVITDYNNNTTNFWGRNKDKLVVPIIISMVTTLLTILITKLLGWI